MPLRTLYFDSADDLSTFVNSAKEVASAAIAAGGTGYAVDDILTLVGGTFERVGKLRVTTVTTGAVTAVSVEEEGAYTVVPTDPVAVTGGSGNDDATFNLTVSDAVLQADFQTLIPKDGSWYLAYWV